MIDKNSLYCSYVAVKWLEMCYSTIAMFYFKQKITVCKIDPLFIVKSRIRIESHICGYSRGIVDSIVSIYLTINWESMYVDVHITTINSFQPEG